MWVRQGLHRHCCGARILGSLMLSPWEEMHTDPASCPRAVVAESAASQGTCDPLSGPGRQILSPSADASAKAPDSLPGGGHGGSERSAVFCRASSPAAGPPSQSIRSKPRVLTLWGTSFPRPSTGKMLTSLASVPLLWGGLLPACQDWMLCTICR